MTAWHVPHESRLRPRMSAHSTSEHLNNRSPQLLLMDAGEPSYTTSDTPNTEGGFTYGLGFVFIVLFLLIILSYASYIYNRSRRSQSQLPPMITSFDTTTDSDYDEYHFIRLSQGLDEYVLATFPTFLYSEVVMLLNGETNTSNHADYCGSAGCSVCLEDYKPVDVIRLLPECGHMFHVSCVDKWLRVHPTCPVCRNSPLPTPMDLT